MNEQQFKEIADVVLKAAGSGGLHMHMQYSQDKIVEAVRAYFMDAYLSSTPSSTREAGNE